MHGKLPGLKPLEIRKRLLIAESELNRVQLVADWEEAIEWRRTLSAGAKTVGSIASAAALIMQGIRTFRRRGDTQNGEGPSWVQPLIKGTGLISSLWGKFRSRGREERDR